METNFNIKHGNVNIFDALFQNFDFNLFILYNRMYLILKALY